MARIRSIKPEFWTSAQILECSPNARLMFIGIWNFADDAGRHPWSIKQIKAEIFPAEGIEPRYILEWLQELESNGLIKRYVSDNKDYFYITGWTKHQRIDKPHKPKYPDPFGDNSTNIPRTLPPDTIRYDKIREDKKVVEVAPKGAPAAKGSRLPEGWLPSLEGKSFADSKVGPQRTIEEIDKFRDYWCSIPGQRGLKLDWQRTWLNWIRNAGGNNGHRGQRSLQDDTKSVSKALGRMEEAAARGELTIKPRPTLLPAGGESHLRLLPKG